MNQGKFIAPAILSHDLRTPLNAIIGYSEMLLEECTDRGWAEISQDLQRIIQAGRTLLVLIKDAFDPARIESLMTGSSEGLIDPTLDFQIRTYMNGILGYIEMALEDADREGRGDFIPDLEKIHTATRHFLARVDEIADLGLEASQTEPNLEAEIPCYTVHETITSYQEYEGHELPKRDARGFVLIVDDNSMNRDTLARYLEKLGHSVKMAENGLQALEMINAHRFDLIILDIIMPLMDGFQVLVHLKADKALRDIPVVINSSLDDFENITRGIRMGADDYLSKPFDPTILQARIDSCLQRKRWHDQEQNYLAIIKAEREKTERLLLQMLPAPIVERLKQGEKIIADGFTEVTVLFTDLVNFTPLTTQVRPRKLVMLLNDLFCMFDQLVNEFGLEKIRAIGDEFVVAGGVPVPRPDHAEAVADLALAMQKALTEFNVKHRSSISMRTGIDTGPLIAGVIGTIKFSYDLWGDAINMASRMQSHGLADRIQVTAATYKRLRDKFVFEKRGVINVKGKGEMLTYFLNGRRALSPT